MTTRTSTFRHRRSVLATLALALVALVAACGGRSAPTEGPAAVVKTALDMTAAKNVEGLRALACVGQEDRIRDQLGLPAAIGSDLLPGIDTQAVIDAVKLDVAQVKVGDPVVTGSVATVPVSGTLGVTFDAVAMRPILRQLLATQGTTMTDAQIDALLKGLAAYGQAVPLDQSIRLVQESGTWKICQEAVAPSPS